MAEKVEIIAELKNLISGEMRKINADINRMESSLQAVNRVGNNNSGGIMGQVLGANLLTSAIQNSAGALIGFGKDSLDAYGKSEQFFVALKTLLGGNELEAEKLNNQLIDLAKTTPFELTEVQEATRLMIAYGSASGSVVGEMKMLGDVSSGTSQPLKDIAYLYGTVRTQGKANLIDMRQFANRGIPIFKELAKVTKYSVKELVAGGKDVDVTFQDIEKAFKGMTGQGGQFFNMMNEQSKTLDGKISNLKDSFGQLKVGVGEMMSDIARNVISALTTITNEVSAAVSKLNRINRDFKSGGADKFSLSEMGDADKISKYGQLQKVIDASKSAGSGGEVQRHQQRALLSNFMSTLSDKYLKSRIREEFFGGKNEVDDFGDEIPYEKISPKDYMREMAMLRKGLKDLSQPVVKPGGIDVKGGGKNDDLEKLAQANKPTQININIENLVREMTNNIQQTAQETLINMAEQVSRVLTGAVNDVSVLQQI